MRGLAADGPTRTGHRMPAVIVDVPVNGTERSHGAGHAWMFQQALATGVHVFLLWHADTPVAVRAFMEAVRFPLQHEGVGQEGLRKAVAVFMAHPLRPRFGTPTEEYMDKASGLGTNVHTMKA